MVNIQIQGQEVTGTYDEYNPIPKKVYQANITEAEFSVGTTQDSKSKHVGKSRTLLKFKFDCYGAASDGQSSRPYWENLVIDHDAANTDEKIKAFVAKNQQKATDIALQAISRNSSLGAQFAQGLNAQSVAALINSTIYIELDINKKTNENFVASFYPAEALQQQTGQNQNQGQSNQQQNQGQQVQQNQGQGQNQGQQQVTQQQNYQNQPNPQHYDPNQQVQQNAGNGQSQNNGHAQGTQNAGVQQNAGTNQSHSNQGTPAFMVAQN